MWTRETTSRGLGSGEIDERDERDDEWDERDDKDEWDESQTNR